MGKLVAGTRKGEGHNFKEIKRKTPGRYSKLSTSYYMNKKGNGLRLCDGGVNATISSVQKSLTKLWGDQNPGNAGGKEPASQQHSWLGAGLHYSSLPYTMHVNEKISVVEKRVRQKKQTWPGIGGG